MSEQAYMTGPQVCQFFSVCDMTIARWLKNERLNFPRPIRINNRRYWQFEELKAWAEAKKSAP